MHENAPEKLHQLLGIDVEKLKVQVLPLWEEEPEFKDIKFQDEPISDYDEIEKFLKLPHYLQYLALLPEFLEAAVNEKLDFIKNKPKLNEKKLLESLEISYSYNEFLFFTGFQSLAFTTRSDHGDSETEKMKIVDLSSRTKP